MEKVQIGPNGFLYSMPMPMVIIGADGGGRANFMALARVTRTNYAPPRIGIALGKTHHTNAGIREHQEFGVDVPHEVLRVFTDHVGHSMGAKTDKSGSSRSCGGDQPSNELLVGEIVERHCDPECLADGKPDIERIRPFALTMPDNRYRAVGAQVGEAWSDGRGFRKV
jgi:flavin reductase (DIM6/NTAB) family NADH-FMN oxidoreductase RutF